MSSVLQAAHVRLPYHHNIGSQQPRPRRRYDQGPLPIKLSDEAPRNARIVGRSIESDGTHYTLQIGGVILDHVVLQEVLDYVSPLELEEFEHAQFKEENDLLQLAASDHSDSSGSEATETLDQISPQVVRDASLTPPRIEIVTGRHGRARPKYTHMFLPIQSAQAPVKRRRRKRDPRTGELLPLSDRESSSSEDEPDATNVFADEQNLPKRRRRKRDPATGELIPLSPIVRPSSSSRAADVMDLPDTKRPRRRRHPITHELMPLGWRYEDEVASHRPNRDRAVSTASVSVRQLTLEDMHGPKRVRLNETHLADLQPSSMHRSEMLRATQAAQATAREPTHHSPASYRHSQEPRGITDIKQKQSRPPRNSMLSILTDGLQDSSQEEDGQGIDKEGSDDEEAEWAIDSILSHRMSHHHLPDSTSVSTQAVKLYEVRWETGQTTWEPIESFPDKGIIKEYEERVRQMSAEARPNTKASSGSSADSLGMSHTALPNVTYDSRETKQVLPSSNPNTVIYLSSDSFGNGDSDGNTSEQADDEYEVEAILGHHLSDPRTHASNMAKDPVMLYKVKWRGFDDPSWEPVSSFPDRSIVDEYRRRMNVRN